MLMAWSRSRARSKEDQRHQAELDRAQGAAEQAQPGVQVQHGHEGEQRIQKGCGRGQGLQQPHGLRHQQQNQRRQADFQQHVQITHNKARIAVLRLVALQVQKQGQFVQQHAAEQGQKRQLQAGQIRQQVLRPDAGNAHGGQQQQNQKKEMRRRHRCSALGAFEQSLQYGILDIGL